MAVPERVELDPHRLFFFIDGERINPDARDVGGIVVPVLLNVENVLAQFRQVQSNVV